MVKVKNKKRNLCDAVKSKKDLKTKKVLNPFEVHINKEKLKVLGRKLKNDRGLPGVSRARAQQKRKQTLLPEYEVQNKSNKFMDRRIGERNGALSAEDRSMARYTAVRVKQHNRKSIFNLADDEVLTHRGQTLSEIEKFDDPRSDDEEDVEESKGNLESKFVGDAHFGGGMLKKGDGVKSHKDLIEQLIAESKKRKAEQQKQKEATVELTEKLDTEWKDLLPIVSKSKINKDDEELKKKDVDDYDKVMRELKFEARGTPSDKLKSVDEIAKEEKEKLERLEQERLARMRGVVEEDKNTKHRSADDLDDNFDFNWNTPDFTLAYDEEGKSNFQLQNNEGAEENGSNASSEDEGVGDDNEDEEESNDEDNLSDLKESDNSESEDEFVMNGDDNDDEDEENENASDDEASEVEENEVGSGEDEEKEVGNNDNEELEVASGEDEETDDEAEEAKVASGEDEENEDVSDDEEIDVNNTSANKNSKNLKSNNLPLNKLSSNKRKNNFEETTIVPVKKTREVKDIEQIKQDLMKRKEMMEEARKELPYTYSLPETYENLQETLQNQPPQHHAIIIERMIKCNHPSLKEGNKESLNYLFIYLLQYLSDLSEDVKDDETMKNYFQVFTYLVPQFFDLALVNPKSSHTNMSEVIKEKQGDFREARTKFPGVDVLIYLKLISALFSTSDFKHAVAVPSIVFAEQMLTTCKVRTRRDVAYGLFLISIIAEYTTLSKRYLPAAIRFLSGIIHMAIPKSGIKIIKVLPPFKNISASLALSESHKSTQDMKLNISDLLFDKDFDNTFRVQAMNTTLGLLQQFYNNFQAYSSCPEIFEVPLGYLKKLPKKFYPSQVSEQIVKLVNNLDEYKGNRNLEFLVMEKKKPKALRLYEPNIVKVYDGKRHKVQSREKTERDKLLHKVKREKKGALREIRRDKAFLGRVKISKRIESDQQRKEKVKKIYAEAAMQQSELNSMDRKNSRDKKKNK